MQNIVTSIPRIEKEYLHFILSHEKRIINNKAGVRYFHLPFGRMAPVMNTFISSLFLCLFEEINYFLFNNLWRFCKNSN